MASTVDLLEAASALLPWATDLRRDIHAHPELGLELPRTQSVVLEALAGLGLDIETGRSLSSVTAVLDTGRSGPTVLLRADMDALPLPEDTGLDFASTSPGVMHACGHDAHVAMLAAAAHLLAGESNRLSGRVAFMFQPGEEGGGGAEKMIAEGLLEKVGPVDLAFAIHQSPTAPAGFVITKPGTIMASADEFTIEVVGRGGHASMPHQNLDPIPIACEIVLAIQSLVTRKVDVFDPAVVTVAQITAGTTSNVVPERARLHGTIRAVSARTRQLVHDEVRRVAEGVAMAHGAVAEVEIHIGYPVTVNDATSAGWVRTVAATLLGEDHIIDLPTPVMGAEDFSYVLERVPGSMVVLGTCPEGVDFFSAAPVHSNRMILNESAMATGIALHTAVAIERGTHRNVSVAAG
jgi:hippurate hydrolase